MTLVSVLTLEERCFFRDQLRQARAGALLDGEGFHPIVAAIERLGALLHPRGYGLKHFEEPLLAVARRAKSAPTADDPSCPLMALPALFTAVREGRNSAIHEGAYARHLVRHCLELSLYIEDGLMADARCVADFMVRDPTCAYSWQPIALARQQMLINSFSCLPIRFGEEWKLLSDFAIASYLVTSVDAGAALRERISVACERGLLIDPAAVVGPQTSIVQAIEQCGSRPVLVVEGNHLLGIATPFDFL